MSEDRLVEEPPDKIDSILVGGEEATKIYRGWFIPGDGQDFMATTILSAVDGKYKCIYRFRYHASSDAWDKRDVKRWYCAVSKDGDIDKLNQITDEMVDKLVSLGYGGPASKIDAGPDGDINLYMELLQKADWAHSRTMPAPEPEPKN